jgi:hypothetical protein
MSLSAQVCTPDTSFSGVGIYPEVLPSTYAGSSFYSETVTAVVPVDTLVEIFPGIVIPVPFDSVTIDNVVGLPTSFNFVCEPSTCAFPGGTSGCAQISGVPSLAGAGIYPFTVYVTVYLSAPGITIVQPDSFSGYQITIYPDCALSASTVSITGVTSSSAEINWTSIGTTGAEQYRLDWKDFITPTTVQSSFYTDGGTETLLGLAPCALHRARILTRCLGQPGVANSGAQAWVTSGCRLGQQIPAEQIQAFPNPNSGEFTVAYSSFIDESISIQLYDLTGRLISTENHEVNSGSNSIFLNYEDLNPGMYILNVEGSAGIQTETIVIN